MTEVIPWMFLAATLLAGLIAAYLAWRVLIWVAHLLIAVDRALFGRGRKPRPQPLDLPGPSRERHDDATLNLVVAFDYVDAEGARSHRSARIDRATRAGQGALHVEGICFAAHAVRTFRPDRMSNLVRLDTGEAIADPTSFFRRFL